jgi:CHAD domain-containing protein
MSDDAFGQILAKLTEIEQGLTARLIEAEQALTIRMNNQFERVLNRLTAVESDLHNLRSEHSVTRDLVMKLPATVLGAIEQPLLRRMTAIEERVGKLEDREPRP